MDNFEPGLEVYYHLSLGFQGFGKIVSIVKNVEDKGKTAYIIESTDGQFPRNDYPSKYIVAFEVSISPAS